MKRQGRLIGLQHGPIQHEPFHESWDSENNLDYWFKPEGWRTPPQRPDMMTHWKFLTAEGPSGIVRRRFGS